MSEISPPLSLQEAMEYRYRLYEQDYLCAKRERMDNIVLWALTVMNEIQRILRLAGLPEIEEMGE